MRYSDYFKCKNAKRCLLGWSLRNFGCWAVVCSTRPLTLHYSGYLNVLSRVCLYQKYYSVYRSDFLGIWVQWHLNPWLGHSYLRHRYTHYWQVLMSDTEEILEEDYPDLGMPICQCLSVPAVCLLTWNNLFKNKKNILRQLESMISTLKQKIRTLIFIVSHYRERFNFLSELKENFESIDFFNVATFMILIQLLLKQN